jgi:hypothetical protein
VIVLLPATRLLAFTVKVAVAVDPDEVSGADPSETFPAMKVTLPVAAVLPVAGFTVAVNCVVAVWAMLAGLAAIVMVVAIFGEVAAITTVPDDAAKPVAPA